MIKAALFAIVLVVAGVLAYAATKPDHFRVERTLLIDAEPANVFPLINDLGAWEAWSPWAKKDPDMESSSSGAASGLGAIYEWSGNSEVGSGRMEIIDTSPASMVRIELAFIEPFATTNMVQFSLAPVDEYTEVTWAMDGPMPYASKLFSVFVPMDDMIGQDFETGLRNLKTLVERQGGPQ